MDPHFFRKAEVGDVGPTTELMKSAFKLWEPIGFDTSALTEATVASFLVRDGYALEDSRKRIVGSVCINFGKPKLAGLEMTMNRAHRTDATTLSNPSLIPYLAKGTFGYFYSLAVDPNYGKSGLGQSILNFFESESRRRKCIGVLLETAQKTGWLVEWYERSGFQLIGHNIRNGDPLVFMLKKLDTTL